MSLYADHLNKFAKAADVIVAAGFAKTWRSKWERQDAWDAGFILAAETDGYDNGQPCLDDWNFMRNCDEGEFEAWEAEQDVLALACD